MATTSETIDHTTLARLVEAGAIRGADVIGQRGGWGVVIKYGMTERALAVRRGSVRIFPRFETLVSYLKEIGIAKYQVDASGYAPELRKASRARPDTSQRMRNAHEAAAYDVWFRDQVQASIDDPLPSIEHDEVSQNFARCRDELRQRIK
jgi:hypothetical protein